MIGCRGCGPLWMAIVSTDRAVVWNHDNIEHRLVFAKAMAPLVAVLWKRKEDFGAIEARIYMRTLKSVSAPILVAAVEKSLELDTWFPEPSKLLGYAADAIDAQRKAVRDQWLTDCADCYGSRWVSLTIDGVIYEQRCGCWTRAMQAMAEVGEPIKRPALQASNPEVP